MKPIEQLPLSNRERSLILRRNYKTWKTVSLNNSGYFVIFQGFAEGNLLKELSGNALRLYIYLGLNSNNYEGIVWHSNDVIAKYFGKSQRTIRLWMKELEDKNLILRMRLKYDGNVYTYLKPYVSKIKPLAEELSGILFLNNYKELCFQGDNNSFILDKSNYKIDIFLEDKEVIEGKLIKHYDENDGIYYILKSNDNKYILNFKKISKGSIIPATLYI